jgi:hypothetical protein
MNDTDNEFNKAFDIAMSEISIAKKLPASFKNDLLKAFNKGSNREGEDVADKYLLEDEAGWLSNPNLEHYEFIEQFVNRLSFLTYGLTRRKSLEDNALSRPYWVIVSAGYGICKFKHLENVAQRYDSDFWQKNTLPCAEKLCGCHIRAFDEEGIKEHAIFIKS